MLNAKRSLKSLPSAMSASCNSLAAKEGSYTVTGFVRAFDLLIAVRILRNVLQIQEEMLLE